VWIFDDFCSFGGIAVERFLKKLVKARKGGTGKIFSLIFKKVFTNANTCAIMKSL